MDRRRTSNLNGKCGSCRFFTLETGKECVGYCSGRMKQKGRLERTYKCIGYEAAPAVIPAGPSEAQREYEASVEQMQYCELYEPTYDPDTGAL